MTSAHLWAVKSPSKKSGGFTLEYTVRSYKSDSIAAFMEDNQDWVKPHLREWAYWYRRGYRCVKVWIVEEPPR